MSEHCDHECVCPEYDRQQDELNRKSKGNPCQNPSEMGKCNNDTRNHPDPLTLLEAWRSSRENNENVSCPMVWLEESVFIKQLHINPEAVRQQGIKEGWWKK